MQLIVVTDPAEARRAKGAQYTGLEKKLVLAGQAIHGIVKSVAEIRSAETPKWIVSISPSPERNAFTKSSFRTRTR